MKVNPAGLPRQCLLLACLSAAAGLGGTAATGRCGSIYFDGSLGNAGALNGPNFLIPADRGKQVGGNLFHSFSDFNLIKDDAATFQGPANVQNILARVTGGSASSINGTLRSEIPGANLYFINPAGVMFGANAKLDISGSFAVTTADYLKLADGGKFNAHLGGNDTLTAAPVSAFGFVNPKTAAVTFNESQLSVPPSTGLYVIAGDVALHGASLRAPSGFLTVFSAASPGEVPFDLSSPGTNYSTAKLSALGATSLTDLSLMSIDGAGGGKVVIRSGKLTVNNSTISSANSGPIRGGDVELHADSISVLGGALVATSARSSGKGGDLRVRAGSLRVDGDDGTNGSGIRARGDAGSGDSGDLDVIRPVRLC